MRSPRECRRREEGCGHTVRVPIQTDNSNNIGQMSVIAPVRLRWVQNRPLPSLTNLNVNPKIRQLRGLFGDHDDTLTFLVPFSISCRPYLWVLSRVAKVEKEGQLIKNHLSETELTMKNSAVKKFNNDERIFGTTKIKSVMRTKTKRFDSVDKFEKNRVLNPLSWHPLHILQSKKRCHFIL